GKMASADKSYEHCWRKRIMMADVLITGDRALLDVAEALRAAEGLLIIHPKGFLDAKGRIW
ncbi:MAG: hypothetical protein ACE10K_14065, partial [Rhodothermales bacterium]